MKRSNIFIKGERGSEFLLFYFTRLYLSRMIQKIKIFFNSSQNVRSTLSSSSSSFSSSSHNFFCRSRFWMILAANFMSARTTCLWDEMPFTDLILRLRSLFTIAPNSLSRSYREKNQMFIITGIISFYWKKKERKLLQ